MSLRTRLGLSLTSINKLGVTIIVPPIISDGEDADFIIMQNGDFISTQTNLLLIRAGLRTNYSITTQDGFELITQSGLSIQAGI